jgi:hypothetical protein
MNVRQTLFALAALLIAAPSAAQTPVSVGRFDSVELRGGGRVTIRHGAAQRVTLLSGNTEMSSFSVDRNGRLVIRACVRSCSNYRLEVEIVTPQLEGIAISGGGSIRTESGFAERRGLTLAINGGGELDATAVPAANVSASVNGGGAILTRARTTLAASIHGGGAIRYRGDPAVSAAINGGGTVRPITD